MSYGDYPDLTFIKKILVIKLRHLGDVLLTGPVFQTLKRVFPKAQIDAYLYQEAIPMLEGHPAVGQIIGYDRGRGKSIWREAKRLWDLRQKGYDLVINLTEGDRGVIAALSSGAKVRVGMRPKGKWQRSSLTHIGKDCPSPRHTVERNLDLLRRIGIFPTQEDRELSFHIPEDARARALSLTRGAPFFLIHPTSRWRFKCWPVAKMRAFVEKILQHGTNVVLTAGSDPIEQEMAAQISAGCDVLNLAGRVSLKELGALIEQSQGLLCVDSLPFHLASALKKPVIALFGPTSEITWGPWRNPHAKVLASPMSCRPCYLDGCGGSKRSDCLDSIPLELVWSAFLELERFAEVSAARL